MSAGFRSVTSKWFGGLANPVDKSGWSSRIGFWFGGLSSVAVEPIPATTDTFLVQPISYYVRKFKWGYRKPPRMAR